MAKILGEDCEKAGEPVKTVETIKGTKSVEHYCIKDICMQFPNPPHLYYCLYYPDACDDFSECLEEFWYGYLPANEMPQHCPDCEVYQGWGTGRGRPPEGGWLTTRLTSHQVIAGLGVRSGNALAARP